jgi:hypothetical protein
MLVGFATKMEDIFLYNDIFGLDPTPFQMHDSKSMLQQGPDGHIINDVPP